MEANNTVILLSKVKQEELYGKLILQLQKDFRLANIPIKLSPTVSVESLSSFIKEKLYVLIMEHFDVYLNLLYVVDVPENSIKNIKAIDVVEVAEQVSYLVVKREFEKVSLKKKFGG